MLHFITNTLVQVASLIVSLSWLIVVVVAMPTSDAVATILNLTVDRQNDC